MPSCSHPELIRSWAPWQEISTTDRYRAAEIIAISCDDWDLALKNIRYHSIRQPRRDIIYGNKETHISAIFCDDWKDPVAETPSHILLASNYGKSTANRDTCQTLLPELGDEDLTNDLEVTPNLPRHLSRRKSRKRHSIASKKKRHPRKYARSRTDEHITSKPEGWLPLSIINNNHKATEIRKTCAPKDSIEDQESLFLQPVTSQEGINSLPTSALPGLNMAINMATLTRDERDIFISLAPEYLKDPCALMNLVSKEREDMMNVQTPSCSPTWNEPPEDHTAVWDQGVEGSNENVPWMDEIFEPVAEADLDKLFDEFVEF